MQSFFFPLRNLTGLNTPLASTEKHSESLLLDPASGSDASKKIIIPIYFILQIFGGHVGVPIILATLYLSKGMRRHPLLINFLVTWVLYSTSFCLLLYVGMQFGPEPPNALCLSQASLIYGTSVMCSAAGLAFVINLWFGLNTLDRKSISFNAQTWRDYLLLTAPYILFVVFVIAMAVVGAAYPQVVTRERYFFYCTINLQVVDLVPGCSGIILLCVVIFEVLIGIKLYYMQKSFAQMNVNTGSGPALSLHIRVFFFSIYSILALLACMGFWTEQGNYAPYIIQASLPTAAFVIFGTQKELLNAWGITQVWYMVQRKRRPASTSKPLPPTPTKALIQAGTCGR